MSRTGWEHETLTVPTDGLGWEFAPGQYTYITKDTATITIHYGATAPTTVLYRVRRVYDNRAELVPLHAQRLFDEASWFPTKWELNREAAIKGARAQEKKHKRVPKTALVARTSFQQLARLPCYRGIRSR